jgi:NAD(P)-dependent dehydrogenase (short-subunit alcohol dehydrogenase family)
MPRRQGAERLAQAIIERAGEAIAVGADVSMAADVARLFKEVHSAFGRLEVLVNNAGIFRFGAFAEITEESFHLHYNINVLGTILTVQEPIKRFGARVRPSTIFRTSPEALCQAMEFLQPGVIVLGQDELRLSC